MNLKKNRIVKYILLIFAFFFIVWNIIWAVNYYQYYKFIPGYMKAPKSYVKSGEDYTYTVGCPSYLSLTGNFALNNNENMSILIWPSLLSRGTSQYGVRITDEDIGSTYSIYVDEDLNYIDIEKNRYNDSEEKTIQILLEKYQIDLNKMRQEVRNEWQQ